MGAALGTLDTTSVLVMSYMNEVIPMTLVNQTTQVSQTSKQPFSCSAEVAKPAAPVQGFPGEQNGRPASLIPCWKPFPVEQLPERLGDFVTCASKALDCDPTYVALPLLSGLASAIGTSRKVQLKPGWTESPIIWTGIIGSSGSLKTPAMELALQPVFRRQRLANDRLASSLNEYREAQQQGRSPSREARELLEKEALERPDFITRPRYLCADLSVAGISDCLKRSPHGGLLIYREELGGWLWTLERARRRGKGEELSHLLGLHGPRDCFVDGSWSEPGVPRGNVSICGGIHPNVLKQWLAQQDFFDGLVARFLLAMPPRRIRRWTGAYIDATAVYGFAEDFDPLFKLGETVDSAHKSGGRAMQLSDGARAEWRRFYDHHAQQQTRLPDALAAVWAKLESYAARLALLFSCHHLTCELKQKDVDIIDAKSMASSIALVRWFGYEAQRIHAVLSQGVDQNEQQQLLEIIRRNGGEITVRDLRRYSRRYRNNPNLAQTALDDLVEAGLGVWVSKDSTGARGRPADVFRINR